MARYLLVQPIVGQPPGCAYQVWPTGTSVADTSGNAMAGDITWPAICAAPTAVSMQPLDSAAQALLPGSTITTLATFAAFGAARLSKPRFLAAVLVGPNRFSRTKPRTNTMSIDCSMSKTSGGSAKGCSRPPSMRPGK